MQSGGDGTCRVVLTGLRVVKPSKPRIMAHKAKPMRKKVRNLFASTSLSASRGRSEAEYGLQGTDRGKSIVGSGPHFRLPIVSSKIQHYA